MSALSLRKRERGTRRRPPARRPRISGGGRGPGDGGRDGGDRWRGDGDGWRDDGDDAQPAHRRGPDGAELARFGLGLLMIAIGSLFLVFVAAFLYLRTRQPEWPPAGRGGMPLGLWVSTLLLVASSVTMQRAVHAAAPRPWLARTLALGCAFLAAQAWVWLDLLAHDALPSDDLYHALFYAVTGLHAAHLVGGLIAIARAARRARRAGGAQPNIATCARYWHFMGFVWIVLFALLYAPNGAAA